MNEEVVVSCSIIVTERELLDNANDLPSLIHAKTLNANSAILQILGEKGYAVNGESRWGHERGSCP